VSASGRRLLANIGAEEGEPPAPGRAAAWVHTVAGLWQLLFPADARCVDAACAPALWPAAWGERPRPAVFPWLESEDRSVTAWLNTEAAAARAAALGGALAGPGPEVVQRVHDKAFALQVAHREALLPRAIADLVTVFDADSLARPDAAVAAIGSALARWPGWARRRFTLKPRFGCSGRGRVAGVDGRVDTPALRGALARLADRGGALLEPWLDRSEDLSASLVIGAAGEIVVLGTTRQCLAPSGLYRGQRGSVDSRGRVTSRSDCDEPLREAAATVARAAAAAGFWGPCGLDAFVFRHAGEAVFRPVVEFNARFSLGTLAIGLVRRGLSAVVADLALHPGDRAVFHFGLDAPAAGWPAPGGGLAVYPLWRDGEPLRPALVVASDPDQLDDLLGAPNAP
jgi:hypothetical protein